MLFYEGLWNILLVRFQKIVSREELKELDFDPNLDARLLWWFKKNFFIKQPFKLKLWLKKNPIKLWLVTLEREDFESNLHIFRMNHKLYGKDKDPWDPFFPRNESNLRVCAKKLLDQGKMKRFKKFDKNKATDYPWIVISRNKKGPFMILDGSHRALNYYANTIIKKNTKFEPVINVLCGICNEKGLKIFDNLDMLES